MEEKNSPYYYGNFECPPTILTVKHHNAPVITQEMPWDVNMEQFFEAFITAAIGIGFGDKKDILEYIREYADEYLPQDKEPENE